MLGFCFLIPPTKKSELREESKEFIKHYPLQYIITEYMSSLAYLYQFILIYQQIYAYQYFKNKNGKQNTNMYLEKIFICLAKNIYYNLLSQTKII